MPPVTPVPPAFVQGYSAPQEPVRSAWSQKRLFQMGLAGVVSVVLIASLVGVLIGYVIHGGGGSSQTGNSADPAQSAPEVANMTHHQIGETASANGTWDVTASEVRTQKPDEVNQTQKANDVYLMISVTLKNTSSEPQTVSSLIQFALLGSDGTRINEAVYIGDNVSEPSGTASSGSSITGTLVYEIGPGAATYQIEFLSGHGVPQAIWDVKVAAQAVDTPTAQPTATPTEPPADGQATDVPQ